MLQHIFRMPDLDCYKQSCKLRLFQDLFTEPFLMKKNPFFSPVFDSRGRAHHALIPQLFMRNVTIIKLMTCKILFQLANMEWDHTRQFWE